MYIFVKWISWVDTTVVCIFREYWISLFFWNDDNWSLKLLKLFFCCSICWRWWISCNDSLLSFFCSRFISLFEFFSSFISFLFIVIDIFFLSILEILRRSYYFSHFARRFLSFIWNNRVLRFYVVYVQFWKIEYVFSIYCIEEHYCWYWLFKKSIRSLSTVACIIS